MKVRRLGLVAALATGVVVVLVSALGGSARAGGGLAFGHAVVVENQRVSGEPSLSISPSLNTGGHHDIYVSAPYGFSTTASFVWKSEDGGQSFHLVGDEAPPLGKPATTCAGGGDSSIVNDNSGNLYFADLQGLTDVSDSVSVDGGNTFVTTCNSAEATAVDRPWLAVYGDPLSNGREYMAVDDTEQCDPDNCGLGQTGSNVLGLTSASGTGALTQTFTPAPAQQIEPDGIVGGAVVDQRNGDLYLVHTAYTDANGNLVGGSDGNGNDNAVVVDRFPGGFDQSTASPIPSGDVSDCKPYNSAGPCTSVTAFHAPLDVSNNSTANVGQDFSPIAIDRSGNLYVTWAQSPVDSSGNVDGPTTIYLAISSDGGATWTKPINVSSHVSGLATNVFPWVAAGNAGRVDIVWYGTPTLGSCPGEPCGAGFITGTWNVYMAQTLNAVTTHGANPAPSFTTTKVSEYPVHTGQICEFGIACTTGGDRGLLDFIQVQADPSGAADIVYADGANDDFNGGETSGLVDFVQQTSGPGLYGGTISGTSLSGSAPGSSSAYFAGGGSETAAAPGSNMSIVKSSVTKSGSNYIVTMKVGSLASLQPDPTLGGTDAIWLTRWELPNPHPTTASQGHVFYAAMESDAGGAPTFYDGDSTCGVPPSNPEEHCKVIAYPPGHTITGSYTASGTITLTVPMADVGGSGPIYSVTGVTGTQSLPGSSGAAIFNVIDSTPPYDVR
ncbi:MAG TPA: hypothetical protein VKR79_05200 [Gaiellaceae bacterium]|nr:hypothetical protein [Gaiellaceae bacterium]